MKIDKRAIQNNLDFKVIAPPLAMLLITWDYQQLFSS